MSSISPIIPVRRRPYQGKSSPGYWLEGKQHKNAVVGLLLGRRTRAVRTESPLFWAVPYAIALKNCTVKPVTKLGASSISRPILSS
jgi:hypothetical protein